MSTALVLFHPSSTTPRARDTLPSPPADNAMPPRSTLTTKAWKAVSAERGYICPSCRTNAPAATPRPFSTRPRTARHASRHAPLPVSPRPLVNPRAPPHRLASLASATAIDPPPPIVPHANRALHHELHALRHVLDHPRLQLALESLESSTPVVRVALLGLDADGARAAARLARALFSDPLAEEEQWERELVGAADDGQAVLLKFGHVVDTLGVSGGPAVRTLRVPSPILRSRRVEILVSTLDADAVCRVDDAMSREDALLVPNRVPVHKAVVVARGLNGAVRYGGLPGARTHARLVTVALDVPSHAATDPGHSLRAPLGHAVDVDRATNALRLFRSDKANGARFGAEWQASALAPLADWVLGPPTQSTAAPQPRAAAVLGLVDSVLATCTRSLDTAQARATSHALASSVPDATRASLHAAVAAWAADAHADLQNNLDAAFARSPSWRRTAWYRLFWRIDDVSVSAAEVLHHNWLADAERRLAFLCGRLLQAGLATEAQLAQDTAAPRSPGPDDQRPATPAPAPVELQPPSPSPSPPPHNPAGHPPPWPPTLRLRRASLAHHLIPALHMRAQALLFTAISTTTASLALAAWFAAATTTTGSSLGLYEAAAIAAFGLVRSLRRLQTLWGRERRAFERDVRDAGRGVLREVEARLRALVTAGGRVCARDAEWERKRRALEGCRRALEGARGG